MAAVGFSESDALLINVLSGALSIGACLLTVLLIDRIGRRPLLWIGSVGMSVALVLMVVAFASGSVDGRLQLSDGMGRLALVAANVYVVFFNMSWGPVMWVMLGEMFPNQIRGPALAVAGAAQWTSNFAITVTFPMLLAGIGLAGAYGIYAVAAILSIVFVVRYVRETKGRSWSRWKADGRPVFLRLLSSWGGGRPADPGHAVNPSMGLDGAIHGANGPGSAGLPPLDTLRMADAGLRVGIELAAEGRSCSCRLRGKLSGGAGHLAWTVGAMDGAIEHGWAFACPGQGGPPLPRRNREAHKRPIRPQSLQPRKTEKPAQGGLFRFLLRRLALPRGLEPLF